MPYKMVRSGNGYTVVNQATGKKKNRTPMPKAKAAAYMRALYANEPK